MCDYIIVGKCMKMLCNSMRCVTEICFGRPKVTLWLWFPIVLFEYFIKFVMRLDVNE